MWGTDRNIKEPETDNDVNYTINRNSNNMSMPKLTIKPTDARA